MPGVAPATGSPIQPLHIILAAYPIACFSGAFVTDITYVNTNNMMWADFSAWLIAAGVAIGVIAAIVGIVEYLIRRNRPHPRRAAWPHTWGNALVLLLSLINAFVHSRDAYTSVMPAGLILSGIVTITVFVTNWMGSALTYGPRGGFA